MAVRMEPVRAVLSRLAVAIIGYFVLFGAYLFVLSTYAKHLLGISTILKISATTLALPFIDLVRTPVLLVGLILARVAPDHLFHAEIIRILSIRLAMEVALFALVIASIVVFERSQKTRRATIFFYACLPALSWFLWSQLYLFIG